MDKLELEKRFTYKTCGYDKVKRMQNIRNKARELAVLINESIDDCREKSTAITKLEEVTFWANAGLSRDERQEV